MEKKTNGEEPKQGGKRLLARAHLETPPLAVFPPFSGANRSQSLAPSCICRKQQQSSPLQCTKRWGEVGGGEREENTGRGGIKKLNPARPLSERERASARESHFLQRAICQTNSFNLDAAGESRKRWQRSSGRPLQTMRQQGQPKGRAGPRAASSPSLTWERRDGSLTWPVEGSQ